MRQLPDFLDGYIKWAATNSEPHERFHTWCGISMMAAAIKRKCYMIWDNQTFTNLYIVLVARSGLRKGSAIDKAEDFMDASGVHLSLVKGVSSVRALVDYLADATQPLTIGVQGGSPEHSSITVLAEEYTVFLGHENKQLVDFLVKWWNCPKSFPYLTAFSGSQDIRNVWVNILAGTTPVHLSSSLMNLEKGGGLAGRTLFIYAGEKKCIPFPFMGREEEELRQKLLNDYKHIASLHGMFTVSEDYLDFWGGWYEHQEKHPPQNLMDKFGGYVERRAKTLMKLSMLLSASRSGEMVIRRQDAERGLKLLEEAESEMDKAFTIVVKSDLSEVVTQVGLLLLRSKTMLLSQLYRATIKDIDPLLLKNALIALTTMNKIKTSSVKNKDGVVTDKLITYLS